MRAGCSTSSPALSTYATPSALPLRCSTRRAQQPVRNVKFLCFISTGSSVLVGCALAPIMHP